MKGFRCVAIVWILVFLLGVLAFSSCKKVLHNEEDSPYKTLFDNDQYTQGYLADIYSRLYIFIKQELEIETRICNGDLSDLSPDATSILSLWRSAFQIIEACTLALQYIPIGMPPNSEYFICQFSAIRGLLSYQVATLWGQFNFVSSIQPDRSSLVESYGANKLLLTANSDFSKAKKMGETIPEGYINKAAVLSFQSLVEFSQSHYSEAKRLLVEAQELFYNGCPGFTIAPYPYSFSLPTDIIKGPQDIVTSNSVKLLLEEASQNTNNLVEEWRSLGPLFGYWQMLVRTKKAQEVTGCQAYHLLWPIPSGIVRDFDKISQNPGY